MNKLWSFGDSFTKGAGVADPGYQYPMYKGKEHARFTTLLAEEWGMEDCNEALNGLSNDMIFDSFMVKYKEITSGDKVIFGLTKIPRLGVYAECEDHPKTIFNKTALLDSRIKKFKDLSFGEQWLGYIRKFASEEYEHTLAMFEFCKETLEAKNVQCVIWDASLWKKFTTIAEESRGRHSDYHWGMKGHYDMRNYVKNLFEEQYNI